MLKQKSISLDNKKLEETIQMTSVSEKAFSKQMLLQNTQFSKAEGDEQNKDIKEEKRSKRKINELPESVNSDVKKSYVKNR